MSESERSRTEYGKMAGKVGILCNVLLCSGKFAAGILSGSVSIAADAANNLSDASSSVISLIGFKLSEKSPDREHPYGHGRYEYLAGFIVAAMIIVIGAELLRDSVIEIIDPTDVKFGVLQAAVLIISILMKIFMMIFYLAIAKKIDSETLRAAAADSRNDVISTSAVLAALIISHFTSANLDGIMGALVAVFILYSGICLVKDTLDPLLGTAPSEQKAEEIRGKILSYEGVCGAHDLMIHDYGPGRQFASVHVEVPADISLTDCHEIIDKIERDFFDEGLNMLIHPDPIHTGETCDKSGNIEVLIKNAASDIFKGITVHDLRTVTCADELKIIFDCSVPDGCGVPQARITEKLTEKAAEQYPGARLVISFESGFASIPK